MKLFICSQNIRKPKHNQSILKEISPGCSLEGMMLKLKLRYSWEELTHWKRPWCWAGLGAGGEGDDRVWDGWLESPTRWTWVWVNSEGWWWTGRLGVLRFMGSQRVGHDWMNWTELSWFCCSLYCKTCLKHFYQSKILIELSLLWVHIS